MGAGTRFGVASGALVFLTAACGQKATGGGDGGVSPAGPPILIGASLGLTGDLSGNARALNGGIAVAQRQINAAGGILGRQVQFQVQDDASDPAVAPKTIASLMNLGVYGILGPGASSEVAAVAPTLAAAQIVELSATATSPALTAKQTGKTGYFFRTVPNDDYQGKAVVQFALRGPGGDAGANGCQRMAIVHNNDSYGTGMDAIIEPYFTSKGGTLALPAIVIPPDVQSDYKAQATAIIAAQPDCMVMIVFAPAGDQLVRDVLAAKAADTSGHDFSKFFIIGTDGCYDPSFITNGRTDPSSATSMSWVEGVYGTNADTAPPGPDYSALRNLYVSQIGLAAGQTDMDPYTANEYDAAVVLALAIQSVGSLNDRSKIRDAMFNVSRGRNQGAKVFGPGQIPQALEAIQKGEDVNYNGASGPVDFTDSGDVVADFIIWRVTSQAFQTYSRITAADLGN